MGTLGGAWAEQGRWSSSLNTLGLRLLWGFQEIPER